jgi:hypothetical protein
MSAVIRQDDEGTKDHRLLHGADQVVNDGFGLLGQIHGKKITRCFDERACRSYRPAARPEPIGR